MVRGNILVSVNWTVDVPIDRLPELPPLPVVRSQLLAVINTPATQLARLLNEPGRQVAQVRVVVGWRGRISGRDAAQCPESGVPALGWARSYSARRTAEERMNQASFTRRIDSDTS